MHWKVIKSNPPKQQHRSWGKREAKLISKSDDFIKQSAAGEMKVLKPEA